MTYYLYNIIYIYIWVIDTIIIIAYCDIKHSLLILYTMPYKNNECVDTENGGGNVVLDLRA